MRTINNDKGLLASRKALVFVCALGHLHGHLPYHTNSIFITNMVFKWRWACMAVVIHAIYVQCQNDTPDMLFGSYRMPKRQTRQVLFGSYCDLLQVGRSTRCWVRP